MHWSRRMTRSAVVAVGLAGAALLAFAGGVVGHDRLAAIFPTAPAADAPPAWMSEYANAFCGGDTAKVASRVDVSLASEDDVNQAFARRDWRCDAVHYLGSSTGKGGTAYIYILHDPSTGLDNWWVFTTAGQKIVRID
jgi:hypothetical protein